VFIGLLGLPGFVESIGSIESIESVGFFELLEFSVSPYLPISSSTSFFLRSLDISQIKHWVLNLQ